MIEIVKINLDNEMDLILAHKRTMKLAELCGLSIANQTTFATAVSEIARCAISIGNGSHLILSINTPRINKKEIVAVILDKVNLGENTEALAYARRLMGDLKAVKHNDYFEIKLTHHINFSGTISEAKIQTFKEYFKNEPPISPYDEIRKKNIQLIEISNKLQESEKQYQMLSDTLPLMMFAINNNGEVTYSNKWLVDFFSVPTLKGSVISWQSMLHSDDYKVMSKKWETAQHERTIFRGEGRLRSKGDKYVWHLITIVPSQNEKGIVQSWIGFFVDIDSQKQVEETLKDNDGLKTVQEELRNKHLLLESKLGELKISNENLEQFAFIASHDLQEPIRKIKIFTSLLEQNLNLTPQQTKYFFKIRSSADRMSSLINNVLEYSRLSNKGSGLVHTDLNDIMETILVDYELLIEEKKAVVMVSPLPKLEVIPSQIIQLFSNLLHNSLKFCERIPRIEISSKEISEEEAKKIKGLEENRKYINIKFKDNGIGFSKDYSDKIFVIFQRLKELETPGTGIGLALCKKIVENHNGVISAKSENKSGSEFNIYFPFDSNIVSTSNLNSGKTITQTK
ncbi:MAG: evgS [Bacteroidetes bacterium]|jgi:PAS domain S-box-containing protein|nr:evgS [Bacteroidota bacterium]